MSEVPQRHSFQTSKGLISGRRNQKLVLTHLQKSFTVRHRLKANSLASPYGPFMVELFAV